MGTTIRDVASVAGVSTATVSRAMSGGRVSPETRDAVLRIASRMDYRPNRIARGLTTGLTGNVGLLVPDLGNPFFTDIVKGVSARVRLADRSLFMCDTDEETGREREAINSLIRNTDGLILCSPRISDDELFKMSTTTATVIVNRAAAGIASVTSNAQSGMQQALAHLRALGHRRVAYVAGPADSWIEHERRIVLPPPDHLGMQVAIITSASPTFDGGILAGDMVVATNATAVIAYNDLLALGILQRLNFRGIRVPEDLSLIGHDDIAMASMCTPSLTTVRVDKERLGAAAANLLLRILLDRQHGKLPLFDDKPYEINLPASLAIRESTGVAPAVG